MSKGAVTLYSLLLAFYFLTACSEPSDSNGKPALNGAIQSVPRMTGFILKHYEGANLAYTLKAKQADIYEDRNIAKLIKPELVIYEEIVQAAPKDQALAVTSGPVKIDAVGDRGEINLDTKDVILEGNVLYQVKKTGTILNTSKLFYWSKRRETEVPVGTGYTLRTPTGMVEGSGLISKEDLK